MNSLGIFFIACAIYAVIVAALFLIEVFMIKKPFVEWMINSLVFLVLSLILLPFVLTNSVNNYFLRELAKNMDILFGIFFVMSLINISIIKIKEKRARKEKSKKVKEFVDKLREKVKGKTVN